MQHEGDGLHLNGSRLKVASGGNVPLEVGGEAVALKEVGK